MFGIGWSEMLIVGVIALMLLGEDKFPEFVKIAIRAFRDFRGYWDDVRNEVEKEIRDPLKQHLKPLQRELQNLAKAEPTYNTPPMTLTPVDPPTPVSDAMSAPEGAYASTPTDEDEPLSQDFDEPSGSVNSEDAKVMQAGAMPYVGGGPGARPTPAPSVDHAAEDTPAPDAGLGEPVLSPEPADEAEPVDRREPYGTTASDHDDLAPPTRID